MSFLLLAKERDLGLLCFATGTRSIIVKEEADLVTTIAQYLATALDREITNQQLHKAQQALGEHARVLEAKVQERTSRLQDTISELETFSYTVAHDLRAPVRVTTGYCEVLLEDFADDLPPEAREVVQRIARASARMETLTRDLLEFSRVSRQEVVLSRVQIELILRRPCGPFGFPRSANPLLCAACCIRLSRTRAFLQHVFSNLIDNAVKICSTRRLLRTSPYPRQIVSESSPSTRARTLVFSSTETLPHNSANAPVQSNNRVRISVRTM